MSKVTTYTCDRCNKVIPPPEANFTGPVFVAITLGNGLCFKVFKGNEEIEHICESCLDEFLNVINQTLKTFDI